MAGNKQNKGLTWLIVDGYNVIGAWPFLKEKPIVQDARDTLKDILMDYCGYRNYILLLVFDAGATEKPVHEERLLAGKADRMIFTEYGQTADQYIERFVHEHEKEEMIVASSDQLIQVMIFSRAVRMSARELYIEIEESRKSIEAEAKQLKKASVRLDARIQEDVAHQLELWRLGQYQKESEQKIDKNADEPKKTQTKPRKQSNLEKQEPSKTKEKTDDSIKPKKRRKKRKRQNPNQKERVNDKSKNNGSKR